MKCLQSNTCVWFATLLLGLVVGCGGGEESSSPPGEDEVVSPVPPKGAEKLPEAGESQIEAEDEAFPRVEIETSVGTFTVKLDRDRAPMTVRNFLKYVDGGFYDGTVFHEISAGYAVVGGGYTEEPDGRLLEKGTGLVGIHNEAATALPNTRGTIAMARALKDADSAKCQFFFNLRDNHELDYAEPRDGTDVWQTAGYCAFGQVEGNGLAILDKIASQEVTSREGMDRVPVDPVTIVKARRL